MKTKKLLEEIEQLRSELEKLVTKGASFNNQRVIKKSQELDKKLNIYNDLINKYSKCK